MRPSAGLHHVTAVSGAAQANLDFHAGVLGQRLVKRTVNFDDPGTYHLYYGDTAGSPGTLLTFFPWAGVPPGRAGSGETAATTYAIPPGSLGWWREHLHSREIDSETPAERFGAPVLAFRDPHGLRLELVESELGHGDAGRAGVPAERALSGFHSVTLEVAQPEATAAVLTEALGFLAAGEDGDRSRFAAAGGGAGSVVDLVARTGTRAGLGAGSVHHVAFRARDDAHQLELRRALIEHGLRVTDVAERCYFRSIYFREPGGVLFEIATDSPGFAIDEPVEHLGEGLKLPPWLEDARGDIERTLPPIRVPGA